MKSTVIALLATSAHAQAPDGTAIIDCGLCDDNGYNAFQAINGADTTATVCDTDADCSAVEESRCGLVIAAGGDMTDG